jgi:hypothetical protein
MIGNEIVKVSARVVVGKLANPATPDRTPGVGMDERLVIKGLIE